MNGQILIAGELVVNAKYNWYRNQQPNHHFITVTTRTILHPQLEGDAITDFRLIPTSICYRTYEKKSSQGNLYVLLMPTTITY